ncbi:SDR family NAD(P)-dependent oxidoreductase [Streptomyces sp. NPDC002540]
MPEVVSPVSVSRSVTVALQRPAPGLELPGLRDRVLTVVDGGSGLADAVVEELRRHGVTAVADDAPGAATRGLILLGGLRAIGSSEEAVAVNRLVFQAVRDAAGGLAEQGVLVTAQDTGGDFGLDGTAGDRAWLGGIAGLARTAAKEWPGAAVKALDVERGGRDPQKLAAALIEELLYGGSEPDVGLRADGSRWVLREETREVLDRTSGDGPGPVPGSGSVIVATGGARGVTAAALLALAEARQPAFALLGRTELVDEPDELRDAPDERELKRLLATRTPRPAPAEIGAEAARILAAREVRATIAALEAAGSTVRYLPVDARDAEALGAALTQVRADLGPVTGLVHAAGVIADARLTDKTDKQFDSVFGTKAEGLRTLLAATADDPLNLICLFSSVAGRFGNSGQADYAMANEVLAQVASTLAAHDPHRVVRSLTWGPWDGGMVDSGLRRHLQATGVDLIPLRAGAEAFVREVTAGDGPARVTLVAGERPDALDSGSARTLLGSVRLTAETHPYLIDHAVAGAPVLPMALALEWFVGAARGRGTDAPPILRDIEVLRGLSLPDLAGAGHELTVGATPDGDVLDLTLDGDRWTHYRARTGASPVPPTPARDWSTPPDVRPLSDVYDGSVLFHGPAFHVLEEVSAGPRGAVALVRGVRALGWPAAGARHTDPAAVDAGLQVAVLWAKETFGAAFLPMGAGEARVHAYGPVGPRTRCVVLAHAGDTTLPSCDVALLDEHGTPLVELMGVSLVRRPDISVAEATRPGAENRN